MDMFEALSESVSAIRKYSPSTPAIGVILGTGLGGLVSKVDITTIIEYDDIPHFPISTVESHHGRLVFGTLNGVEIVVMQGRFHAYEGYTLQQITFPVRILPRHFCHEYDIQSIGEPFKWSGLAVTPYSVRPRSALSGGSTIQ